MGRSLLRSAGVDTDKLVIKYSGKTTAPCNTDPVGELIGILKAAMAESKKVIPQIREEWNHMKRILKISDNWKHQIDQETAWFYRIT